MIHPRTANEFLSRRLGLKRTCLLEGLETRVFMSVTQPSFADFSSTTGLVGNGFGGSSITSGTKLQLTTSLNNLARSVWWNQPVPVSHFTTHFSFIEPASANSGDGLTFTLQNASTAAVGGSGADLGYGTGTLTAKSVAVAFNLYNGGSYGSKFGIATGGTTPATPTNIAPADLHNGDTYNATLTYDGTTLVVSVTDASNAAKTFSISQAVNIPQVLGTSNAIVGFTASTGNSVATQDVTKWDYLGSNAPSVATPAAATPTPVTGTTTSLSVLGADAGGESGLTYAWSVLNKPSKAKTPTFSTNGANGSKLDNVKFFAAGTYTFRATITNASSQSTTSDVTVVVQQTPTTIRITPHGKKLTHGKAQQFTGAVLDQFGATRSPRSTLTWSIAKGKGTIKAATGLYTAPSSKGHLSVRATDAADKLSGTAGETIV